MTVIPDHVWKKKDGSPVVDMGLLTHSNGEWYDGSVHAAKVEGVHFKESLNYRARLNAGDFYIDIPRDHKVAILGFRGTIMGSKVWEGNCNYDMALPGVQLEHGVIFRITELRASDPGYGDKTRYRAECEGFAPEGK